MIGIGVDIVQIERIRRLLYRFGQRFPERILSVKELRDYNRLESDHRAAFLARRFAAKEAVAKAIGKGIGGVVAFVDIEIDHEHNGRPQINFGGHVAEYIQGLGGTDCQISIADEREYAIAFAILM
ncbi:MAG: holo-ACP synthase [Gammaproteobacteria bacterium]|nr:MAG: holo-ACP synthase [Gammaproteobacteria bacterium]